MATSFPVSLDELINPQASDSVQSPSHSEQHADANDAIAALQEKVGVDNSTDADSLDYKIRQIDPDNFDPAGSAAAAITTANEYTDEAVASLGNSLPETYVPLSDVGNAEGVASLGPDGFVPQTELDIDERIQDTAAAIITSATHTNITVNYDSVNKELSLTSTGGTSADISSTAPANPNVGDLWLDSDTAILYIYDGAFWVEISGSGGGGGGGTGGGFTASATAPASPVEGSAWFDTVNAKLYVYYDSYWVEAVSPGPTGPEGPAFVNYQGNWNSGVSYTQFDGVTYIGSLWRLNENNSPAGTIPSEPDWQKVIHKGDKGDTGEITVGTVTAVLHGEPATVTNTGTTTDAILDFEIPAGRASTINVGSVDNVDFGQSLTIVNSGDVSDAVFDFEIPAGRAATIQVGTVEDVLYGEPPTVTNSGTTSDSVLDFEIPAGRASTINVGTVTTVVDGNPATVVNSGDASDAVFDFEIPAGPRSTIEIGDVVDVDFGNPSTITNVGTTTDAIFDFELQTGRAATVAIGTVTTGNYLTEVEVENVGTVSDAILNISIPQGIPGEMHDFNVRETPPPNPVEGLVWYNTTNGRAYVYYDSAWVEYSPGFAGPRGPMFLNYQGAWDNTEEYVELDGVTHNGSLWVLEHQTSVIGAPPSSPSWSLVVEKGATGEISVGQVTDVLYGNSPTVTNSGTSIDAVLDFEIPAGRASTIVVGTVEDVDYGNPPTVINSGDTSDAVFDFEIPAGRAATIVVGTVDDVDYGNPPTVTNSGTTSDAVFDFEVPAGRTATLSVGTVTTVLDGEPATVINSGTTSDAVFDFEIPAGPRSTIQIGDVVDVNFGTPSTVTNVGNSTDAIFDFELQTGRASTLAVGTVETGSYASEATVENVGTVSDAIFNFSIPQGIPGDFQPGENPPSNPLSGQVWYNTAAGRAYVYHDGFWIEFSPGFVGPQGEPGTPGVTVVSVPSTNSSPGAIGEIAYDSGYLYVCVASDSWIRVARSAW